MTRNPELWPRPPSISLRVKDVEDVFGSFYKPQLFEPVPQPLDHLVIRSTLQHHSDAVDFRLLSAGSKRRPEKTSRDQANASQ